MTTATNPQTGEKIELVNGQWIPVKTATNPQTGEKAEFIGGQWVPVRSFADRLQRQAGLTGRALIEGALGLPPLLTEVPRQALNLIPGVNFPPQGQAVSQGLTQLGFPQPASTAERIAGAGGRALAGGGASIGLGQGIGQIAPAVSKLLTTQPATQLVSAGAGGLSGEGAKELGFGPAGQIGASLLGGFATTSAMQGVKNLAQSAQKTFQPTAEQKLRETAQLTGQTAAQVKQQLAPLGEKAVIAEASPGFMGLAQGAVSKSPATREIAGKALTERTANLSGRLLNKLGEVFQKEGDIYDDMLAQINRRAQIADPLYKQAYAQPIAKTIQGQKKVISQLSALMKTDAVKKAIPRAQQIASNEGRRFDDKNLQHAGVQVWDDIKRGLDDVIESNRDQFSKLNQVGNSVRNVKQRLLKVLDTNRDYKLARNTYAGESDMLEALKFGGDILKTNIPVSKVKMTFNQMNEAEKEAAISGLAGAIRNQVGKVKEDTQAALNFIRTPNNKVKITSIVGKEGFNKLNNFVEKEATFRKTQATIVGGSQTQLRQAAERSINKSVDIGLEDTTRGGIANKIVKSVSKLTGLSDKEAIRLTQLVTTPQGRDEAIKILSSSGKTEKEINYLIPTILGYSAGQIGNGQ